ncbi:hypothetical protein GPECTOR_17g871 [Gonium pectorale]|uniref:Major facilitator superfamily (MFS) profile domain-containing protein n=1 Tax=Gonium pectorale TaxID=33097 RepID=A0A150GK71_GONPE|nr:hypothetical protein GPECTOR_17g871 [Gonium pectorale]|eukprot:KXZ50233.1 hypothetical protein GPECTOR_17g871 [Gonium pectorale]
MADRSVRNLRSGTGGGGWGSAGAGGGEFIVHGPTRHMSFIVAGRGRRRSVLAAASGPQRSGGNPGDCDDYADGRDAANAFLFSSQDIPASAWQPSENLDVGSASGAAPGGGPAIGSGSVPRAAARRHSSVTPIAEHLVAAFASNPVSAAGGGAGAGGGHLPVHSGVSHRGGAIGAFFGSLLSGRDSHRPTARSTGSASTTAARLSRHTPPDTTLLISSPRASEPSVPYPGSRASGASKLPTGTSTASDRTGTTARPTPWAPSTAAAGAAAAVDGAAAATAAAAARSSSTGRLSSAGEIRPAAGGATLVPVAAAATSPAAVAAGDTPAGAQWDASSCCPVRADGGTSSSGAGPSSAVSPGGRTSAAITIPALPSPPPRAASPVPGRAVVAGASGGDGGAAYGVYGLYGLVEGLEATCSSLTVGGLRGASFTRGSLRSHASGRQPQLQLQGVSSRELHVTPAGAAGDSRVASLTGPHAAAATAAATAAAPPATPGSAAGMPTFGSSALVAAAVAVAAAASFPGSPRAAAVAASTLASPFRRPSEPAFARPSEPGRRTAGQLPSPRAMVVRPSSAGGVAAAAAAAARACSFSPFSCRGPPMRAFHLSWLALLLAVLSTLAPAALLPVMATDLRLSKPVVAAGGAAALLGGVASRVVMGFCARRYGPRYCQALALLLTAPAVACMALVRNAAGHIAVRAAIGLSMGMFVVTHFWVVLMFDPSVYSRASTAASSWGNLGSGLTMLLTPLFFQAMLESNGGDAGSAWRAVFYFPAGAPGWECAGTAPQAGDSDRVTP